jgi:hypothetical protein
MVAKIEYLQYRGREKLSGLYLAVSFPVDDGASNQAMRSPFGVDLPLKTD